MEALKCCLQLKITTKKLYLVMSHFIFLSDFVNYSSADPEGDGETARCILSNFGN
jgi:hypothetical protein